MVIRELNSTLEKNKNYISSKSTCIKYFQEQEAVLSYILLMSLFFEFSFSNKEERADIFVRRVIFIFS